MRTLYYLKNGESLELDSLHCTGCGACVDVCPHAVLVIGERAACDDEDDTPSSDEVARIVNRAACMECGACAKNCPVRAIKVESGVGCAQAIILGKLRGTAPDCDCAGGKSGSCC